MHTTIIRRFVAGLTAVTVAGLALVSLAAPAVAAEPRTGHYSHTYDNPETPFEPDVAIDFNVSELKGELYVEVFQWQTYSCSILTVTERLAVSSTGKFKFKGKASTPGTAKIKIKVKGKFTSGTKAKVTLKDKDPNYTCGKYKATVKRD